MCSKMDSTELMISKETDEIIKELFESLLFSYKINLKESMKGRSFVFDYVYKL